MAAKKPKQKATSAQIAHALTLFCEGHATQDVLRLSGVDWEVLFQLWQSDEWTAAIAQAQERRIRDAAAKADAHAAEWAEHDRQEKEAATAIQSAVIQLVPRRGEELGRLGGKGHDVRMAVSEIDQLASAFLKAQKGRRIASGRPVERTEVETNSQEEMIRKMHDAYAKAIRAAAAHRANGGELDGVPAAPPPDGDPGGRKPV